VVLAIAAPTVDARTAAAFGWITSTAYDLINTDAVLPSVQIFIRRDSTRSCRKPWPPRRSIVYCATRMSSSPPSTATRVSEAIRGHG
jgi:hypothetical protein